DGGRELIEVVRRELVWHELPQREHLSLCLLAELVKGLCVAHGRSRPARAVPACVSRSARAAAAIRSASSGEYPSGSMSSSRNGTPIPWSLVALSAACAGVRTSGDAQIGRWLSRSSGSAGLATATSKPATRAQSGSSCRCSEYAVDTSCASEARTLSALGGWSPWRPR